MIFTQVESFPTYPYRKTKVNSRLTSVIGDYQGTKTVRVWVTHQTHTRDNESRLDSCTCHDVSSTHLSSTSVWQVHTCHRPWRLTPTPSTETKSWTIKCPRERNEDLRRPGLYYRGHYKAPRRRWWEWDEEIVNLISWLVDILLLLPQEGRDRGRGWGTRVGT